MKKILLTTACLFLMATGAQAADLSAALNASGLSSSVEGMYFTDDAFSAFIITTCNTKGAKVYGTGSFTTAIYVTDCAADPCVDADNIGTEPGTTASTFAISEFTDADFGDGTGTVLGGS